VRHEPADVPAGWDPERHETELQRLDRNWANLLQELRVLQTGVALLTGFLLTLPFADGFEAVTGPTRLVYLITVSCSLGATILMVAPVGMHRFLFRRRKLAVLVATSHRLAMVGLALLGLTLAGVATLVFQMVLGPTAAAIAGGCALLALGVFWVALPLSKRC